MERRRASVHFRQVALDGATLRFSRVRRATARTAGAFHHQERDGNRRATLQFQRQRGAGRGLATRAAYERSYKKPIKWFALPQLFRYERQQKGRLREHFQFNADLIGEKDAAADAELIALLIDTLVSFGLTEKDFVIRLSSRNAWHDFFVQNRGASDKEHEFYQIIDKLEREDPQINEQKLS